MDSLLITSMDGNMHGYSFGFFFFFGEDTVLVVG